MAEDDEAPIGRETAPPAARAAASSSGRKGAFARQIRPPARPTTTQPGPKSPPPQGGQRQRRPSRARGQRPRLPGRRRSRNRTPLAASTPSGKSGPKKTTRSSKHGKTADPPDSGVRIVPLDDASDSDVKIAPDPARRVRPGGPGVRQEAVRQRHPPGRFREGRRERRQAEVGRASHHRGDRPGRGAAAGRRGRANPARARQDPAQGEPAQPAHVVAVRAVGVRHRTWTSRPPRAQDAAAQAGREEGRDGQQQRFRADAGRRRRSVAAGAGQLRKWQALPADDSDEVSLGRADGGRRRPERHQPARPRRQRHFPGAGRQRRDRVRAEPRLRRHAEARPGVGRRRTRRANSS